MSRLVICTETIKTINTNKNTQRNLTRLNMDLRYFPEREHSEHWQWILFAFFEAARHNFDIV